MGLPLDNTNNTKTMGPIATAGIGIGTSIVGGIADQIFGEFNQQRALRGHKKALKQQNDAAYEMWEKTNYSAQKEQMKKAGLNPALMYGMSGGGGVTTGPSSATAEGQAGNTNIGMGIQAMAQLELLKAQKENIEADTEAKRVGAQKTATEIPGVLTENENKILEGIIKKYAGGTAELDYQIRKELQTDEYGARADELEARQAVAARLVKMNEDGTLDKMTDLEIKKLEQDLKLTGASITARDLENEMNKIELNLMRHGILKDTPKYLQMAGQLIYFLLRGKK